MQFSHCLRGKWNGHACRLDTPECRSLGQDLAVQLERLRAAAATRSFARNGREWTRAARRSSACLEYLREGDTLLVTKIDRLRAQRRTSIASLGSPIRGSPSGFTDDPSIDTTSRTGKLVMGVLALIAEFENDIRRERQPDGIHKARSAVCGLGGNPFSPIR